LHLTLFHETLDALGPVLIRAVEHLWQLPAASYTGGITVEQFVRVTQEFDASHQLISTEPDRPRCGRVHGHRWTIEVEKRGREDGLEGDVFELAALELGDRHLNEMFPLLNTSPEQLALLFMEKLLLKHPSIVTVEVSDGRLTGIARNTPR
jgi:hypothetical protein